MLVIRCREGEVVNIGNDIEVTVLAASAGRVKLGFNAPAPVLVARRCAELTRQQNRAAIQELSNVVLDNLEPYLSPEQTGDIACVVSLGRMAVVASRLDTPKEFAKKRSRRRRNG